MYADLREEQGAVWDYKTNLGYCWGIDTSDGGGAGGSSGWDESQRKADNMGE